MKNGHSHGQWTQYMTRRSLLIGAATAIVTRPAKASVTEPRQLHLYNVHTDETLREYYHNGEGYIVAAWGRLNWFLRDHRANVAGEMDPRMFDILWNLQQNCLGTLGKAVTVNVHSAFRTEATNAQLIHGGAAPHSFHKLGRAVDISVPGVDIGALRSLVQDGGAGGIGIYARSRFAHLDSGPPRSWQQSPALSQDQGSPGAGSRPTFLSPDTSTSCRVLRGTSCAIR